jgi:hypothetical protein
MSAQLDRLLERMPERRNVPAQTKLTPSESAELDKLVEYLKSIGVHTTRSSTIRALVVAGEKYARE